MPRSSGGKRLGRVRVVNYSAKGLASAGLDLVPPFQVELCLEPKQDVQAPPVELLTYRSIARLLPGRRLSGIADYQGAVVFAKLFYGKGARRYWNRELAGARLLALGETLTPAVLHSGATADNLAFVVLYQAIVDPQGLREDNVPELLAAVRQVALLHEQGLMQTDIHRNNFVVSEGQVHLVDADGIRRGRLLRHHFRNLACFMAQRAPWFDRDIEAVWQCYVAVRGDYVAKMGSVEALLKLTLKERENRVTRYLGKTQRECTEFVQCKNFSRNFLCDRQHWSRLARFMVLPEVYIGEGTPLKLGNSATVVRCEVDGVRYVVKRYNIKSLTHRVQRWFKRRARKAWCNGHWLAFLGIETARPVALLEHRFGWFVGVSYIVMPDVGDRDLGQVLSTDVGAFERVADQTASLIVKLRDAGIRHGDLKATNLIEQRSHESTQMVLIDFDALSKGCIDKDKRRFLANWDYDPELRDAWEAKLSGVGL